MGKYDKIVKNLPRAPKQETSDEVNTIKEEYTDRSPGALAKAYREVRAEKAAHDEAGKAINRRVAALEALLYNAYEEAGITSMKLDDGSSVGVYADPYVVTINRDAVREWAVANGHERDLNIHSQTLASIVKERALAGETLPEGVELKVWHKVQMRKG
jgi:hypothetical protein